MFDSKFHRYQSMKLQLSYKIAVSILTTVVYDNAFMLFSRRPIRKQLAYWL